MSDEPVDKRLAAAERMAGQLSRLVEAACRAEFGAPTGRSGRLQGD